MPELVWKLVTEADFKAAQALSDELTQISSDAKLSAAELTALERQQDELNAAIEEYSKSNTAANVSAETLLETRRKLLELDKEHAALLDDMADSGQKSFPAGSLDVLERHSGEEPTTVPKQQPAALADETDRYQQALERMYATQAASALETQKAASARMGLAAVTKELADVENEMASVNDKTLSGLSPLTQQFIKQTQVLDRASGATARKTKSVQALRQALMPLASEIPGLGNAVSIFGGNFTSIAAPILLSTMALKQAYDSHKRMAEHFKQNRGFEKPFVQSADAVRTAMAGMAEDTAKFTRTLREQETASKKAKDALDALYTLRDARTKREQNLDDRRKELDIERFKQKEKDPIKQMEGLLRIEEKYELRKIKREDDAARAKATRMAADAFNAKVTGDNALAEAGKREGGVAQLAAAQAKAAVRAEEAKANRDAEKAKIVELEKKLKEFQTQSLVGLPTLAGAVTGKSRKPEDIANAIQQGATKYSSGSEYGVFFTPADFDNISALMEEIRGAKVGYEAAKGSEAEAFKDLEDAKRAYNQATAELDRLRDSAIASRKEHLELEKQLRVVTEVLKVEARVRRENLQFDNLLGREKLLGAATTRLGEETIDQAQGGAKDFNLRTEGRKIREGRKLLDKAERAPLDNTPLFGAVPTIRPQLQKLSEKLTENQAAEQQVLESLIQQMTGMKVSLAQLQKQIQTR